MHEDQLQKCKNMKQIWELAKSLPDVEEGILEALEQQKYLFSSLFSWLKLKDKSFLVFFAATEEI